MIMKELNKYGICRLFILSQKNIETLVETPIWSSAVLRLLDRKHENLVGFVGFFHAYRLCAGGFILAANVLHKLCTVAEHERADFS